MLTRRHNAGTSGPQQAGASSATALHQDLPHVQALLLPPCHLAATQACSTACTKASKPLQYSSSTVCKATGPTGIPVWHTSRTMLLGLSTAGLCQLTASTCSAPSAGSQRHAAACTRSSRSACSMQSCCVNAAASAACACLPHPSTSCSSNTVGAATPSCHSLTAACCCTASEASCHAEGYGTHPPQAPA